MQPVVRLYRCIDGCFAEHCGLAAAHTNHSFILLSTPAIPQHTITQHSTLTPHSAVRVTLVSSLVRVVLTGSVHRQSERDTQHTSQQHCERPWIRCHRRRWTA